eukprot:COSAG02_NODE_43_length_45989_cov_93.430181_31_plen_91_part_00
MPIRYNSSATPYSRLSFLICSSCSAAALTETPHDTRVGHNRGSPFELARVDAVLDMRRGHRRADNESLGLFLWCHRGMRYYRTLARRATT